MILTYDICRAETFGNLSDWLQEVKEHASEGVKVYLIGNKAEENNEKKREVQLKDAIEFAKQNGIHKVFETSALTGKNVTEMFSCAAKDLYLEWD